MAGIAGPYVYIQGSICVGRVTLRRLKLIANSIADVSPVKPEGIVALDAVVRWREVHRCFWRGVVVGNREDFATLRGIAARIDCFYAEEVSAFFIIEVGPD